MSIWKNVARNVPRVSIILILLVCGAAVFVAQEEQAKAPPSGLTVLVNGVREPVYKAGNGVRPPRPLYQPEPELSNEARKRKIQGVVTLDVVVTSIGKTTQIRVLQGRGYGLDEKAIEAVSKWKFQPGTKDGVPVSVEIAVEFDFHFRP